MTRPRAQVFRRLGIIHGVFVAVFLFRLVALLRFAGSPLFLPAAGDMRFYDDWAQRILHGQITDGLAFFGLPLYPYLLALIYKVFGYTPFAPALFQAVADAVTAMLIYHISCVVFVQKMESTATAQDPPPPLLEARRGPIIGVMAAAAWACFVPAEA